MPHESSPSLIIFLQLSSKKIEEKYAKTPTAKGYSAFRLGQKAKFRVICKYADSKD